MRNLVATCSSFGTTKMEQFRRNSDGLRLMSREMDDVNIIYRLRTSQIATHASPCFSTLEYFQNEFEPIEYLEEVESSDEK